MTQSSKDIAKQFSVEMFAPCVGSTFRMLTADSDGVELELQGVTDLGSSARHVQFSTVFRGPETAPLRQGIYKLQHPELGSLDLFLVPIGKDSTGVRYEAIFNQTL